MMNNAVVLLNFPAAYQRLMIAAVIVGSVLLQKARRDATCARPVRARAGSLTGALARLSTTRRFLVAPVCLVVAVVAVFGSCARVPDARQCRQRLAPRCGCWRCWQSARCSRLSVAASTSLSARSQRSPAPSAALAVNTVGSVGVVAGALVGACLSGLMRGC